MHVSLWILIGPNGILSLPLMSVRMQPPYSDCHEPCWKLHGSLLSAFVPACLEHLMRRSLSTRMKKKLFYCRSSILVCFCCLCVGLLRPGWADIILSGGMEWENRHSRPVSERNSNVYSTSVLLCVLKCLDAEDSELLKLWSGSSRDRYEYIRIHSDLV